MRDHLKLLIAQEKIDVSWSVMLSDANLFDAAINSARLPFDTRPTGAIFRAHVPYQVTLNGIRIEPHNHIYVDAVIADAADGSNERFAITNKEATSEFSKKTLRDLTEATTRPTYAKRLKNYVASRSAPLLYALKRSGDWGQVEHAKKYNKVFVTCDKLAALYAWYREVPFVFMKRQEHESSQYLPKFIVYSFSLA